MRQPRSQLAIAAVALLLGLLVVIQLRAQQAGTGLATQSSQDLTLLVANLNTRNDQLRGEAADLQRQLDAITAATARGETSVGQLRGDLERIRTWAGLEPATGPGIRVAVYGGVPASAISDLLNELRNAGAEAISIGGVRVVAGTVVGGPDGSLSVENTALGPRVEVLAIPQVVAAGTVDSRTMLPSFLYLAHAQEAAGGAYDLPWASNHDIVVGELARRQAAEVPDRTVGAAKSWLAHSRVDRRQPILPWNAPAEVSKVSPVTATQHYLEHLIAAWEIAFPDAPLAAQIVVLTVPASFDASARELTREAALAAGLPENMVLLEEPQSAVYAWLASMGDRWRRLLKVGDNLLVCDVGGGTTDLTLVSVAEEGGELVLERMAVGNHLLVGGDNMDLALAHHVAQQFAERGVTLNPWQSVALWHSCRTAKETLLTANGPEKHSIAVLARGSRLIGGTVSIEVDRQRVAELLVDGFFPRCAVSERPDRRRVSGFREIGLPFETDTAVTRHLAAFLQAHGAGPNEPVRPTHVLFNGGVFKADALRTRLLDVLAHWFPDAGIPQILPGQHDLDHAVARGAAYYGWTKHRGGVRIRGGTARAYYVGIETAGLAIPGPRVR